MSAYRFPGSADDFAACLRAAKAARAEFEPGELEEARARSDAFLNAKLSRARLVPNERDLVLIGAEFEI